MAKPNKLIMDGRGQNMIEVKEKNKLRVLDCIKNNPGRTRTEYCEELGMSPLTLRGHIKALIDEGLLE